MNVQIDNPDHDPALRAGNYSQPSSAGGGQRLARAPASPGYQQGLWRDGGLLGLGRLEAPIMAVAWAADPRWLPVRTVYERLDYPRPVTRSTVGSVMTNLCRNKGLLTRRRAHECWEYRPARSLNDYLGELIAELLDASPSPQAVLSHALRRPVYPTDVHR